MKRNLIIAMLAAIGFMFTGCAGEYVYTNRVGYTMCAPVVVAPAPCGPAYYDNGDRLQYYNDRLVYYNQSGSSYYNGYSQGQNGTYYAPRKANFQKKAPQKFSAPRKR